MKNWALLTGLGFLLLSGCSKNQDEADQLASLESELEQLRGSLILANEKLENQERNLETREKELSSNSETQDVDLSKTPDYLVVFETYRVSQIDFLMTLDASSRFDVIRDGAEPESVDTIRFSSSRGGGGGSGPVFDGGSGSGSSRPEEGEVKTTEEHKLAVDYRVENVQGPNGVSHVIVPAALSEREVGVTIECRFVAAANGRCVADVEYRRVTRLPPANYPLPHLDSANPVPQLQLPVIQDAMISSRLNVPLDESIFLGTAHIAPPGDGTPPNRNRELLAIFCRISKAP